MNNLRSLADKSAIALSVLCSIHCLALPLAIVLLPSVAAMPLEGEEFHYWMLIAVLPLSTYALTMGCKKHQHYRLLFIGFLGLSILVFAAFFGHELLGETGEKALTMIGATILALGHIGNHRLCQQQEHCACPEPSENDHDH